MDQSRSSTPWPAGNGQAAALIRTRDWSKTSLGPTESWPQSLKTAVAIALDSPFPGFVWVGPDLIQLYNDPALAIVRGKHPNDFGVPAHEAWSEIWDSVGPLLEGVLSSGEPVLGEDLELLPDRGGPREPAYFTFSYSALRDESNAVAGVVSTAIETTARVLADRRRDAVESQLRETSERQAYLLKLSDVIRQERDAKAIASAALRSVRERLRLDRIYVAKVSGQARPVDIVAEHGRADLTPMPLQLRPTDFPEGFKRAAEGVLVVDDIWENPELSDLDRRSLDSIALKGFIVAPLHRGSEGMIWALVAGSTEPRHWTQNETLTIVEAAERIWAALERAGAEAALRENEEQFRSFGEASSDVLWIRDAETLQWTYLTPAFETIYGTDRERALEDDNLKRWGALILTEDREHAMAHIERVLRGERVTFEYRIRRPSDGAVRWLRDTDFPLLDTVGRVRAVGGIGRDVTEEKELADRMEVLVAELQHRTRNLMTVIRSVANRSWRESQSLDDFGKTLLERVDSLSRAQTLLSQRVGSTKVAVDDLLRAELAAHVSLDEQDSRVTLIGPSGIRLPSKSVQTLALALHELTTNAVKYGALSQPQGHLKVTWKLEQSAVDGPARLVIDWREVGVAMPVAGEPSQVGGYGRELIERALPYQLQASTKYTLETQGVHCTIALPVAIEGTEESEQ